MPEHSNLGRESVPATRVSAPTDRSTTFQSQVWTWMQSCFRPEVSLDRLERGDRLLEEVFELLQSGDYPPERVAGMLHHVWSRPKGEPGQEVGGVMVTLAAYCQVAGIDLASASEDEYARISQPEIIEMIRMKNARKPRGEALSFTSEGDCQAGSMGACAAMMSEAIRSRLERSLAAGGMPLDEAVVESLERKALQAYDLARATASAAQAAAAQGVGRGDFDLDALLPPGVEAWMVADALAGMSRSGGLSRFQQKNAALAERMLRNAMRNSPMGVSHVRVAAAARLVARVIDSDMAAFNKLLDAVGAQPDTPVRHFFAQILETFAAHLEAPETGINANLPPVEMS